MVYSLQFKKTWSRYFQGVGSRYFHGEVATFGVRYFRDLLVTTKNDVNFGGSLLSEIDGITVCSS